MIPILDNRFSWGNWGNGIARLNDCISCIVTEERNGKYTLEMIYPTSGKYYSLLQSGMTIYCKTSEDQNAELQTFFIEKVKPAMNGRCRVLANHCSYELNWAVLAPKTYTGSMNDILLGMYDDYVGIDYYPIYLRSEGFGSTSRTFTVQDVQYVRSVLGGSQGSLLDSFGGEWEWNNNIAILHKNRGQDNGIVIEYGKNLTGAEVEWDISGYYDVVVAYWTKDGTTIISDPIARTTSGGLDSSTHRAYKLDCSGDYENAPTKATLNNRALLYANENGAKINMTAKVEFQPLWQTTEFANTANLERVNLCDIVTVKHTKLGLNIKTTVVKTVYDVLKDRYKSITLGTLRKTFSDIVAEGVG